MQKYLTNYQLPYLQELSRVLGKNLLFVDLETTGMVKDPWFAIIEIGMVCIGPERILETCTFVDPQMRIPRIITEITGIDNSMVQGAQTFDKYVGYFQKAAEHTILLGYNSKTFDSKGLEKMGRNCKPAVHYEFKNQLDVRYFFLRARNEFMNTNSRAGSLVDAAAYHGIKLEGDAHRAGYDIALTVLLAEEVLKERNFHIIKDDISRIGCSSTQEKYHNYLRNNRHGFQPPQRHIAAGSDAEFTQGLYNLSSGNF